MDATHERRFKTRKRLMDTKVEGLLSVVHGQPVAAPDPHNHTPDVPSTSDEAWDAVEENGNIQNTMTCGATDNDDDKAEGIQASKVGKPWKPFELEAKYCPEVISLLKTGNPQGKRLRMEKLNQTIVRRHLLALGWRIESKIDTNHTMRRLRYISSEGKTYYSLKKVCCYLKGINCPTPREKNLVPEETSMNEHPKPELLPNAIREYEDYLESLKQKEEQEHSHEHVKLLRSNAKNHLICMGWKLWLKDKKTTKELRYTSPNGKTYCSLSTACKAYLAADYLKSNHKKPIALLEVLHVVAETGYTPPSNLTEFRELGVGRLRLRGVRKSNKGTNNISVSSSASSDTMPKWPSGKSSKHQQNKRQKASQGPVWQDDGSESRFLTRKLRSSKRAQTSVALSPCQNIAKTVLNWLIDNDVVLPREKVFYCHKRGSSVVKEGRITCAGIKCNCCNQVFSLASFEAHAGSNTQRPAANIFLQDGKSLLECQMQMLHDNKPKDFPHVPLKSDYSLYLSDDICSVCHDGGSLMICDHCPSAFHPECIGLEDVPEGDWFCPSCRCAVCGFSECNFDTDQFTEKTVLYCDQCESKYHVSCLENRGSLSIRSAPTGNWVCSTKCSKIFYFLRKLLGKSNPTCVKGLSWTLLRFSRENGVDLDKFEMETMSEYHSKLCLALDVLHECFVTMIEPRTRSDLVADLLFNKESELNRLNFRGFYTMVLEKGDELISVATFRVYGEKIAEMPFIGTRVLYRRQGMCRLLMDELEKLLSALGVERLVLPAVSQLLETWTTSFGFTQMPGSDRLDLSRHTLLGFQDTTMCQKFLGQPRANCNRSAGRSCVATNGIDRHNCGIATEAAEAVVEPVSEPHSFGDSNEVVSYRTDDAAQSLTIWTRWGKTSPQRMKRRAKFKSSGAMVIDVRTANERLR